MKSEISHGPAMQSILGRSRVTDCITGPDYLPMVVPPAWRQASMPPSMKHALMPLACN